MTDDPWIIRKNCNKEIISEEVSRKNKFIKYLPIKDIARMITKQMEHVNLNNCKSEVMMDLVALIYGKLGTILNKIYSDDKLLKKIADRSFHHDLFDKIVLLHQDDEFPDSEIHYENGWKLHLHVFTNNSVIDTQESLHSHRNHFVSACVKGKIEQEIWDENDSPSSNDIYKKYMYSPIVTNVNRTFNLIDMNTNVCMKKTDEFSTNNGNMYYMHPSVIHKVTNVNGKTITLVLNSKNVIEKTCFASEKPWYIGTHVRKNFTIEETKEILNELINFIKSGASHDQSKTHLN